MAWLSYLSTEWEISTLHAILLKPHSGVFVWICSHMGCICSFPKEILEMPDKHPPAECWAMGTLCCCRGRCRIERGGSLEEGNREEKRCRTSFPSYSPLHLSLPPPPPPLFAPTTQAACFVVAVILTSPQCRWLTSAFFVGLSRGQAGTKISNNKLFL